MVSKLVRCLLATGILAVAFGDVALSDEADYKLGAQDKVRITVYEWRSAKNEAYEWSALKGEFTVSQAGTLSLPLIGELPVANLRTSDVANLISDKLQAKVGLAQRPDAAVEVSQFRPIYVVGAVTKPGEYLYRPGLTALQAVGIAGGFYRPFEGAMMRLGREALASQGEKRVALSERAALLVRAARLRAELNSADQFTPPALNDENAGQIIKDEQAIFQSRKDALKSQLQSLAQANIYLKSEIAALKAKDQAQERQLTLAKKEQEGIADLLQKGLAISPRALSLAQTVAQIESTRQDVTLAILRAEQDMMKNDRASSDLQNQRRNDILQSLSETEVKIRRLTEQADTAQNLIEDSEITTPSMIEREDRRDNAEPTFILIHREGDRITQVKADSMSTLQPGDILRVERAGAVKRAASDDLSASAEPRTR